MKIDVLFIHPGNHKQTYQELSKKYTAIAPPVWTSLLANYVRNKGYSVAIHDTNLYGFDIYREMKNYYAKLIVLMVYGHHPSASTQTMPSASVIINKIKDFDKSIPIAIGGTHPSAIPKRTLYEEKADFVIVGEGAYQIVSLLDYLNGNIKLNDVQGVVYQNDVFISITNTPSPLIKDLDKELNDYAFDLLPNLNKYRAHAHHVFGYNSASPYVTLNTSLGCPYNCEFCCINSVFNKPGIRYWNIDTVLSWIDKLVKKYHIQHIRFDDELFVLDKKRLEEFCDKLIQRNYNLNIWVYARVDTIPEKLLNKMRKAGINWICLGIESANNIVRTNVKKNINKDIEHIVKSIKDNDINIIGNYMFGLPDDTIETMQETLDLAIKLNCEYANFYCTMAYPGSALYNNFGDNHCVIPKTWEAFSQHSYETQPLPTKYISAKDVLQFRDKAFYNYFSNPKYLNMIQKKFGEKVKLDIEDMLKIKIKRRLLND
jgi:radical SAM superfamily enzyme YgiQ (UPF0313 family)